MFDPTLFLNAKCVRHKKRLVSLSLFSAVEFLPNDDRHFTLKKKYLLFFDRRTFWKKVFSQVQTSSKKKNTQRCRRCTYLFVLCFDFTEKVITMNQWENTVIDRIYFRLICRRTRGNFVESKQLLDIFYRSFNFIGVCKCNVILENLQR